MALMIFQASNFQVQFESTDFSPAELQIVQPRAAALPGTFETDFATLCGWFGIPVGKGFGPSNRVIVTLNKTIRGASEFRAARNRNATAQPSDVLKISSCAMGCIAVGLRQL